MNKKFFKFSLTLNISLSLVAAAFSILFFILRNSADMGEGAVTFFAYAKAFFDTLAVFTASSTVIYAFANFDFKGRVYSLGVVFVSVLIAYVFQIVAGFIDSTNITVGTGQSYIAFVIYYSVGPCFISTMGPAIINALVTHKLTKNGTQRIKSFFSSKNSVQNAMFVSTFIIFLIAIAFTTVFDMWPLIKPLFTDGYIRESSMNVVVTNYISYLIFYLVMQYPVYYFMYKIYDSYVLKNPEKKPKEKS